MGFFKKAGGAAALAGVAGAVSKRLADRKQQKVPAQGVDSPGAPTRQAPTAAAPDTAPDASIADEIEQLVTMRDQGVLSNQEFTAAKGKLLGV